MLISIFIPHSSYASLILRVALGIILIYHGRPKLFGQEPGLKGFSEWLRSMSFPLPMFFGLAVALFEVFGGLALILGLFTRWICLFAVIEFLVVILIVKRSSPWKENELHFLILAVALALILLGSGAFSLDWRFLNY